MSVANWGALLVTILLWGSAYSGIRFALLHDYTPGGLALWRYLTAAVTLAVISLFSGLKRPPAADWPKLAALGLIGLTLYHLVLNTGQTVVAPGAAALLIAFAPVITVLIATIFLGERLRWLGWVGIAVSFGGEVVVTFTTNSDFRFEPSSVWVLLAALCTSIYFTGQKPMLKRYRPFELTTLTVWFGALWLLLLAPVADWLHFGEVRCYSAIATAPWEATLMVVYLGALPGGVAYLTYNFVLQRMPAGRATSLLYLMPIVALIIESVAFGKQQSAATIFGGALCIGGVVLVNTYGKVKTGAAAVAATATPDPAPTVIKLQ